MHLDLTGESRTESVEVTRAFSTIAFKTQNPKIVRVICASSRDWNLMINFQSEF